jgi:hypothetical protein
MVYGLRFSIAVTVQVEYHLKVAYTVNAKQLRVRQAVSSQSQLLNVQMDNGSSVIGLV